MPTTEIDEIFASKGKSSAASSSWKGKTKASLDTPETSTVTSVKKKSKKVKKKKVSETIISDGKYKQSDTEKEDDSATGQKRKTSEPEMVVDSSLPIVTKKRKKTVVSAPVEVVMPKKMKGKAGKSEDEGRFRDSRGTGPRRKTNDGFSIYKEDELGIGDEGGDTPLCPFDCDCCF